MPQVVSLWVAAAGVAAAGVAAGVAAAGVAAAGVCAVGVVAGVAVLVSLPEPPPQAANSKDADSHTYLKTITFL